MQYSYLLWFLLDFRSSSRRGYCAFLLWDIEVNLLVPIGKPQLLSYGGGGGAGNSYLY